MFWVRLIFNWDDVVAGFIRQDVNITLVDN